MSSVAAQLRPGDTGYLLGVLVAARDEVADDRSKAERKKREVIHAFAASEVIVATNAGGLPRTVQGTDGELLLTFTDAEAVTAYWHARGMDLDALRTRTIGDSVGAASVTEMTLDQLKQTGQREVLVNPAGPAGTVITAAELDAVRPRRFLRGATVAAPRWVDFETRASARTATAEQLSALRRAVAAGDRTAAAEIWATPLELNALGSLETAAASEQLKGLQSLMSGEVERGINQLTYAAVAYVRFGFPERCADLMLDGAELLLEAVRDPRNDLTDSRKRLSAVVSLLEAMEIDWRSDERTAFITTFRQLVPSSGSHRPGTDLGG